jgi:hypothetical protein
MDPIRTRGSGRRSRDQTKDIRRCHTGPWRFRSYIAFRRVLPEAAPAILILGALETGTVILTIASLGFLGLGLQPPAPEWGTMLLGGRYYLRAAPHF